MEDLKFKHDAYWKLDPVAHEKEIENLLGQLNDTTQELVKEFDARRGVKIAKIMKPLARAAPFVKKAQ